MVHTFKFDHILRPQALPPFLLIAPLCPIARKIFIPIHVCTRPCGCKSDEFWQVRGDKVNCRAALLPFKVIVCNEFPVFTVSRLRQKWLPPVAQRIFVLIERMLVGKFSAAIVTTDCMHRSIMLVTGM